jgi:hypothetical protein
MDVYPTSLSLTIIHFRRTATFDASHQLAAEARIIPSYFEFQLQIQYKYRLVGKLEKGCVHFRKAVLHQPHY